MSICSFGFDLGFEGGKLVLIAPQPGHCLSFTLDIIHSWYARRPGTYSMVFEIYFLSVLHEITLYTHYLKAYMQPFSGARHSLGLQ